MGIRPYAADCGALVLPLASKVKLRAPSKNLYADIVDIFIEIPRCARDDKGESLDKLGMTGAGLPVRVTLSEPPRRNGGK